MRITKSKAFLLFLISTFLIYSCQNNFSKKPESSINQVNDNTGNEGQISETPLIETGFAKIDSGQIEYFSQGKGEVIVLLSGRALDVGYLEPLATKLAESGYRTIRINRRGIGKSVGSLNNIDFHIHASDIAAVLKSLNISKANILGHAVGSRIARIFCSDYPEMTNTVILTPVGGKIGGTPEEEKATSKMFKPNATNEEIMAGMKFMVGDPANSERVWEDIKYSAVSNPETLKSETSSKTTYEEWWAPKGETNYLALQGMLDKASPPENSKLFKQELGDRVTLIELPNAGHLSVIESADEITSHIVSYLQKQ